MLFFLKIILLCLTLHLLYRFLTEKEEPQTVEEDFPPEPATDWAPQIVKPKDEIQVLVGSEEKPSEIATQFLPRADDPDTAKIIYASHVNEDWWRLQKLLEHAEDKRADLVVLTKLLGNPFTPEEQCSYAHAFHYVSEDYQKYKPFSDIHQYIASFANDNSLDILTVSAKKILYLIEKGKKVLGEKITKFKRITKGFDIKLIIIPGQFENIDVLRAIDPEFASRYLNLATTLVKNIRLLGIGGQVTLEKNAPLYFQNRDYIEGTEQAHEELKEILQSGVDVLVSYTPIRCFADNPFEEENIRHYLSDYLPGKVILTSQELPNDPMIHPVTASDAALIKGGRFGRNSEGNRTGHFWELVANKSGLIQKTLIQT